MAELLSPEEMSALLPAGGEAQRERKSGRRVAPYNFKRPDRISKDQIRSLYLMHDLFARTISSAVSLDWRAMFEASLISVEQQSYAEFLQTIPDPGVIYSLSMAPLPGTAALEISPAVAFAMVDRLVGGPGEAPRSLRTATEIELSITEAFVKIVKDYLAQAWDSLLEIDFEVIGHETRPQFLQLVSPNDFVLVITFHVQLNAASGTMNFCLPVTALEPVLKQTGLPSQRRRAQGTAEDAGAIAEALRHAPVTVAAEIPGVSLRFEDLLRLEVGDVIKLEHRLDEPVSVTVADSAKYRAELVAHNNAKAMRIVSRMTE